MADVSPITDLNPDLVVSSASPEDISVYTVREGDTLGMIAEMFDISPNTIRWANDIDVKGTIKPGQELVILPISGIKHKVAKGETFASIAKKYKGDAREISLFNGIEEGDELVAGTEIIIPNGEVAESVSKPKPTTSTSNAPTTNASGYYGLPVKGIKTQGDHDRYHALDIGAKTGTPIWAMASGRVIVAKSPAAWNGGYGGMVVIQHDNGTQTLYAHLSKLGVSQGQTVTKGSEIGKVGSTGRSTGPHLHVEIRTGKSGINGLSILEKMY
jgi:murein DD-endopeptidase MepM/ murein hydrolase activator NlpD